MAPSSLRDILNKRRSEAFFGREDHLQDYRANLGLAPDDDRRRFVYNIHGNSGVGKSLLLRVFQQIADERGAITARVDYERTTDVLETLDGFADQLGHQGVRLASFKKEYDAYEKTRRDLFADEAMPDSVTGLLTHGATYAGLAGASAMTGMEAVEHAHANAAQIAAALDDGRAWLVRKLQEPQKVKLAVDPVSELTRTFVRDLDKAVGARPLALFLDTFENAPPRTAAWLLDLLEGEEYGSLPPDVVVAVAGQHRPGPDSWSRLGPFMVGIELHPFGRGEVTRFLASREITASEVVESIWEHSQGLPVLVDTLAQASPTGPDDVADKSSDAVDRFLKWVEGPIRRKVATLGALARYVDRDVLALFLPEEERENAADHFAWLRSLRFVMDDGGRCTYHQYVRSLIVRMLRNSSPVEFSEWHAALAEHYDGRAGHEAERTYHALCASPRTALDPALAGAVDAVAEGTAKAQRWASMLERAGIDGADSAIEEWGTRLSSALTDEEPVLSYLGRLIDDGGLEGAPLAKALTERWFALTDRNLYEQALPDIERVLSVKPDDVRARIRRGRTYRELGDLDAALADLDRAVADAPENSTALLQRSLTRQEAQDFDRAEADLSTILELVPGNVHLYAHRGQVRREKGDLEGARSDLDKAVKGDPSDVWALAQRAATHAESGAHQAALDDLSRCIDLAPSNVGYLCHRSLVHLALERPTEALADMDKAVELEPENGHLYGHRARAHIAVSDLEAAVEDLGVALATDPYDTWALHQRGFVNLNLNNMGEGAADLLRSYEAGCRCDPAVRGIGVGLLCSGDVERATAFLSEAADMETGDGWYRALAGISRLFSGDRAVGTEYLDRVIAAGLRERAEDPGEEAHYFNPAICHLALGELEEAFGLIRAMEEVDPSVERLEEAHSNLLSLREVIGAYDLYPDAFDQVIGILEGQIASAVQRRDGVDG